MADEGDCSISVDDHSFVANCSLTEGSTLFVNATLSMPSVSPFHNAGVEATSIDAFRLLPRPSFLRFNNTSREYDFSIEVFVFPNAPAGQHIINVTVHLYQQTNRSRNITTIRRDVPVWVNQFHGLEMSQSNPTFVVLEGSFFEGSVNLTNRGNGEDTFLLTVTDVDGIVERCEMDRRVTLGPGASTTLTYRMEILDGVGSTRSRRVMIEVTSMGALQNGSSWDWNSWEHVDLMVRVTPQLATGSVLVLLVTLIIAITVVVFLLMRRRGGR